ncbi:CPXCG motif-containing cysteine-rich protein [Lysobacter arvi]|uniref:CPXCG motif-containing cysteine-rich protein n=1 Tax=Lysobacter arvi TaxID=3038776 RepID=UPI003CCE294B
MLPAIDVQCPYCGEPLTLFVDDSAGPRSYVEDCHVCCRPMAVRVRIAEDGELDVDVAREDEG